MIITKDDFKDYGILRIYNQHVNKDIAYLYLNNDKLIGFDQSINNPKLHTSNYNEVIVFESEEKLLDFLIKYELNQKGENNEKPKFKNFISYSNDSLI